MFPIRTYVGMPIIAMDYGIVIQTMYVFTLFAIWKHKLNEEV
jgi:hypothetical protein